MYTPWLLPLREIGYGPVRTEDSGLPAEAILALRRGQKIEAIKLTRTATGMGLKESKEAVEALLREDMAVREAFRSAKDPIANSRCR